jgi:hypothetical protein
MQTTASAAIRQPRLTAPTDARDKRDPIGLTPRVTVDLYRLQKTLFRDAGDAPIGQQIEVLALRFDQGQPHLDAALDAGHLDGGLKARTGRRRPGYLQHRILDFPKEETQRYLLGLSAHLHYVRFPTQLELGPPARKAVPSASRRLAAASDPTSAGAIAREIWRRSFVAHLVFGISEIVRGFLSGEGRADQYPPRHPCLNGLRRSLPSDFAPAALMSCDPGHVTFRGFCIISLSFNGDFKMRKIILLAAMALACGAAHAQDLSNVQIAQATTTTPPAAAAPAAAPAPQAAAPEATQPAAQPSKPVKKKQAKRRETDEEKARRIAAKYGVSW